MLQPTRFDGNSVSIPLQEKRIVVRLENLAEREKNEQIESSA